MPNPCLCGCGQFPTTRGAQYVHGHHYKTAAYKAIISKWNPKKPRPACPVCGSPVKSLRTRYCSRTCFGSAQRTATLILCRQCFREMSIIPSRLPYIRFCSIACRRDYYTHQRREFGTGDWGKMREQIKADRSAQCEACGYKRHPEVLVVHHLNGAGTARNNNHPANLKILCPTCHAEHHLALSQRHLGPSFRGA